MLKKECLFLLLFIPIKSYSAIQHFDTSVDRGDCQNDLCVLAKIDNAIQSQLDTAKAIKIDSVTYTFFKKYLVTNGEWKEGSYSSIWSSSYDWSAHNYANTESKDDSITKIMAVVWYET